MKWLIACLICSSTFANTLSVNIYNATTPQSPIKQGAKQVTFFTATNFTGTIGNASTTSNTIKGVQLLASQDGSRLNDISYTVTGGTLIIVDVR